jgi:predicted PurR-regulated permease PerM
MPSGGGIHAINRVAPSIQMFRKAGWNFLLLGAPLYNLLRKGGTAVPDAGNQVWGGGVLYQALLHCFVRNDLRNILRAGFHPPMTQELADPAIETVAVAPDVGEAVSMSRDLTAIRRTLGLILLVLLTMGFYFAKEVILPLLMGTLLALTLSPMVRSLRRFGLAPVITASALIVILGFGVAGTTLLVSGPVSGWVADAPHLGAQLKIKLQTLASSVEVVKKATDQVEQATTGGSDPAVQKVAVQSPGLLTIAVSNVFSIFATTLVTLVLALFLLASGDMFYVKLIDAFPRFGDKKRALRIVYGIERSVSHYLLMVTMINAALGVVIGTGMWLIGMPQPFVWALVAFLVNYLPYIGPLMGAGLATAVAVVSFDHLGHAALAPAVYLASTTVEGQFITPVVLGRQLELNTVSVFVTVVFWGWLWGIAGGLMAVPFLVCLKVICDNVESLNTFGNFLGAAEQPVAKTEAVQV